ncbi:hybrid sensor histidine kinase/response regulator transcription factor [Pedobacter glucosidilyticus]|uniref:hybrid sensor histidine kinase/response regulator transcription factor n=1 Tax=Pedobacter glucosidilyticus TaxID=1122941 RepID=UPI0026EAD1E4|nr:hybrid sensor histidine kinase/response regulator transcription factor [Pedobacter glucosidilyticus]
MFRRSLSIVFLFFYTAIAYGQLSFDHISISSGLSQSTVLSIYKDSRGYMWFGTRDCLNRYDGRSIKIYKNNPKDSSSISTDDYIYSIYEDRSKNLWIGTQDGLNRYIPESDSFERIKYNPKDKNSISDRIVLAIHQTKDGKLFFGTNDGLSILEASEKRNFKKLYKKNGLAGNQVYSVFEDSKKRVWIGTTTGLSVLTFKHHKPYITSYYHNKNLKSSISGNSIKSIAEDSDGNIWIGTETSGLNKFIESTRSFIRYQVKPLEKNSLSSNNIRKIIKDRKGNLWIATMTGLNILNTKDMKFMIYRHDSENPNSLSDNSIKEIYEDNQGSIWLGTMFGGVNVKHPNTIPFTVEKHSKYRNSISSDIISAITADKYGNLWIGTEGQGLNFYNKKTQLYTNFLNQPLNSNSIGHNTVKDIFEDSKGNIWIGLFQGGLDVYNPKTGTFKHYTPDPNNPKALSYGYVSSITEDKDGQLWVATSSKGINLFNRDTETFTVYDTSKNSRIKISSSYIRQVFCDSRGNLWIGTAKGLNLIPYKSTKAIYFTKNTASKTALQSGHINAILEDSKGRIWIGSHHGGLSLYVPKTNSFINYDIKNGVASNNIINILEDKEGYLWVSTDRGLSKFDTQRKIFKNYTVADGLPANEFNYNSAFKDKNGKLYFGSYNGLVSFQPKEIEENKTIPKVVFSGLKLFNKPVGINSSDGLLEKDISFTEEIVFNANQNIFTIDFLALNYINPERNKYAYKLDGFEKDWNYVSTPSATYTNLPPGKYDFLVKASNNDGLWNPEATKLVIIIKPPLWKTWWAYLLYFIMASGLLFLVIRFFRRQARLETQLYYEHLNTQKIEELYQLKLDFFTRISHEIRTPLTLIFAPLENLIKQTAEQQAVSKQIIQIKNNAERLLRLITELLDFRKIETGNMKILVQQYNLVDFCDTIFNSFTTIAESRQIDYSFKTSNQQLLLFFDANQMEKVLYNILSNAFKYTPDGGTIVLALADDKEEVHLTVEDNGIGISLADQKKIFTNFYQANQNTHKKEGWGIGLALSKNIVEQHHGRISLISRPETENTAGKTSFKVSLKKGQAHFSKEEFAQENDVLENQPVWLPEIDLYPQPFIEEEEVPSQEKKYTILIVEDNDELRTFIRQSLEKYYHIMESLNGLQAWELAIEQLPDIIISDVNMPVMDGFELCSKLKQEERTSHIPVILLTAMAANMHQIDGLQAGADIYLTKPFSIQVLELSVKNLLAGREALKDRYSKQVMLMPRKLEIESPDEKFLNKLMKLIEDNLEDPEFNVTSLVVEIGMSQTVLYKKIKALTDLSITDFIKSVRLKRAAQLLEDNQLSIAEIAYSVGFNDRKYFSKEFKKQFGKAPSDYRD